jgi:hypothetical protein
MNKDTRSGSHRAHPGRHSPLKNGHWTRRGRCEREFDRVSRKASLAPLACLATLSLEPRQFHFRDTR